MATIPLGFVSLLSVAGALIAPALYTTSPTGPSPKPVDATAEKLVSQMIETIGGAKKLYALRDVEYKYTYHNVTKGIADVSLERYIFDGEHSWARYDQHEVFVMPGTDGSVTSSFDGHQTTSMQNGKVLEGDGTAPLAFLRKTNFYWFAMFFKLSDPGVNLKYLGKRRADYTDYDVVDVTFGSDVGDSPKDRYVIYINPYTHLVDMFLFNVTGFGIETPFLMRCKYTQVDGALLAAWRCYQPAESWDGHAVKEGGDVVLELSENFRFGNDFDPADFKLATR